MRIRLLPILPLLPILAACGTLVQVQRYDRPRPMRCLSAIQTFDATTFEVPTGTLRTGDTVQLLGLVTRLGLPSGKYLVRAGNVMAGISGLDALVDVATSPQSAQAAQAGDAAPRVIGDEPVGTDDKGRQLYKGPEGGIYYINANGNKTYVTKKYRK